MGIQVEYNPDLALRNIEELRAGRRKEEECIPGDLQPGQTHDFLKAGHRNYYLEGEIPLLETKGNQELSKPLASIVILESTHFLREGKPFTRGKFKVVEVFSPDSGKVEFNGFFRA
jgi:hypothetical protein